MAKIDHNKRRNTGLLYEFLIRTSIDLLFEGKKEKAYHALAIVKKYFTKGKPLYEELKIFRVLLNAKNVKDRQTVRKMIRESYVHVSQLNGNEINREKSRLIQEIGQNFDKKKLYGYYIPDYRAYATIQTLFCDARRQGNFIDNIEKIRLEDVLIDHVISSSEKKLNENRKPDELLKRGTKYSNVVQKFALKRFNEKYETVLSEGQRAILKKYGLSKVTGKVEQIRDAIISETEKVKNSLNNVKDPAIKNDAEQMGKIREAYNRLISEELDKNIDDGKIVSLLKYMDLQREIESK